MLQRRFSCSGGWWWYHNWTHLGYSNLFFCNCKFLFKAHNPSTTKKTRSLVGFEPRTELITRAQPTIQSVDDSNDRTCPSWIWQGIPLPPTRMPTSGKKRKTTQAFWTYSIVALSAITPIDLEMVGLWGMIVIERVWKWTPTHSLNQQPCKNSCGGGVTRLVNLIHGTLPTSSCLFRGYVLRQLSQNVLVPPDERVCEFVLNLDFKRTGNRNTIGNWLEGSKPFYC